MAYQGHSIPCNGYQINYLDFDSVVAFNEFVDKQLAMLSDPNRKTWAKKHIQAEQFLHTEKGWFGDPPPVSINELVKHDSFMGMKLLQKVRPRVQQHLEKYLRELEENVLPKPKVDYNDRGLGMFSFDRAAMGLYPMHRVNTRTPLDTTISQLNIELNRPDKGTTVKKVFAFFKDKDTSYPSMKLYLLAGANANVQGKEMLYVGVACAELITFLEARGIAVELNVLIGTRVDDVVNLGVVRVKRYDSRADINQILLMSSDPRYFRYRGFKALVALSDHFGHAIPPGLGHIAESMGSDFVAALGKGGFVFEQSYSLDAAAREIGRIIDTYQLEKTNEQTT